MDIGIISSTRRTSTLTAHDKHLKVVGVLKHGTMVEPKTIEDADNLIQWLKDWKTKKGE